VLFGLDSRPDECLGRVDFWSFSWVFVLTKIVMDFVGFEAWFSFFVLMFTD